MKMNKLISLLTLALLPIISNASTLLIDDFGGRFGLADSLTSWTGLTPSGGLLTTTSSTKDDNGWTQTGLALNLTPYSFLAITASVDTVNNVATNLAFTVEDGNTLNAKTFTVSMSSFSSSMSTVYVPISWVGFDATNIDMWNLGGGQPAPGANAFRMTFDNIAFTTSAVPEPATYAALFGVSVLGLAVWRKRRAA